MKTNKTIKKYVVVAIWILAFGLFTKVSEAAGWSTGDYSSMGLPTGTIYNIIKSIVLWMLGLFGFFGIVGFVISGIMYLTAAGDDDPAKESEAADVLVDHGSHCRISRVCDPSCR